MPDRQQQRCLGLPHATEGVFGGYAYGVEPLCLPHPTAEPSPEVSLDSQEWERARTLLARFTRAAAAAPALGEASPARIAWFRWITGHQICFILWRLLGEIDGSEDELTAHDIRTARAAVDAYSAMLLYTGSCTHDTYAANIRPSMRQQHPSFSGSWAPDFYPVRHVFRRRNGTLCDVPEVAGAVIHNQQIHDEVADWLVQDGLSLLRRSDVGRVDPMVSSMLYDAYFVTVRRDDISSSTMIAQLLRRVLAVLNELRENPLYAAGDQRSSIPDPWGTTETVAASLEVAAQAAVESLQRRTPAMLAV